MGIVAAFFDIDGTLIDPARRADSERQGLPAMPTKRVAEAIRTFRSAGNRAFVCSGRPYSAIEQGGLLDLFDGCVAFAGAYVRIGNDVIRDVRLPKHTVRRVIEYLASKGISALCESPQGYALLKEKEVPWPFPAECVYETPEQLATVSVDLDFRKFVLSEEAMPKLKELRDYCEGRLTCYNISMGLCEMTARELNKAEGIRAVLDALRYDGIVVDKVLAFGDSANDRKMFEAADIAIAMGNALPEMLQMADYVTEDVAHDGIATALEHFGLI